MSAPIKFASVPSKTLATSINAAATTIQVSDIKGWDGVNLAAANFGTELFCVLRDSTNTFMELMQIDPTTIANSTITIVKRGLDFYGGTSETAANKLTWIKNDTIVELGSNPPQMYKAITDYIDSIAIAGAPNASAILQGLSQLATSTQINAGTATGSTGAPLVVTPDQLALSNYNNLPTASGLAFLNGTTGMVLPFIGSVAPTGFVLADGTSYTTAAQTNLALVTKGLHGLGSLVTFTAAANVITATSHGLSNGTIIFVQTTVTLPTGLSANTPYYVIASTTNTFQVALTLGGSAVTISSGGSGTQSYSTSFKVPDLRGRIVMNAGTGAKVATIASVSGNVFTLTGITNSATNEFQTGQAVVFTAGTAGNLVNSTTYFVVRVTNTTFSLSTTLANAQNSILITLLGTETGSFALSLTARTLGDTGGEENHAMSATELLTHHHGWGSNNGNNGGQGAGTAATTANQFNTSDTGGNVAMNNTQPFTVLTYIIKT